MTRLIFDEWWGPHIESYLIYPDNKLMTVEINTKYKVVYIPFVYEGIEILVK